MEMYRQTTIGETLVEALKELQDEGKITEDLAEKVAEQFDLSVLKAFRQKAPENATGVIIPAKASVKGSLTVYNYIDSVWQFQLEDIELKLNPSGVGSIQPYEPVRTEKAKIVCVDAKLMEQQDE
jgi:transcription initiation factor TFIIA small subunit